MRNYVERHGLQDVVEVDSAGTSNWHVGSAPDGRTQAAGEARGYKLAHLKGRQVSAEDFHRFDYILAMDEDNLANLKSIMPQPRRADPVLFLKEFGAGPLTEVPDPYYGGADGFEKVLDLIETACLNLVHTIQSDLGK